MALRQNEAETEAIWTALEEAILIHLMVKEVRKGIKTSTTFSKRSWKNIELGFYEKTTKRYSHGQFRNKFNSLRIRYNDFSKLLKEPGFSWDPVLGHVTATDDVWELYIKANKKARRFRKKGCPLYNELGIIFGYPVETCKDASELAQNYMDTEVKWCLEYESANATPSASVSDSSDGEDYPSSNDRRRCRRSRSPVDPSQRKKEAGTIIPYEPLKQSAEITVPSMAHVKKPAEVEHTATPNTNVANLQPSAFSITRCVKCLESTAGIEASTYLKAIKMFKDADWREMFMAMSSERRLDWLASLE